ncbi:hypothetical protein HDU86_004061 [Geranomyces michiganensis]|nr:hypothetical protein HDU86_004061 [Geranomyces michiganensis]
MLVDGVEQAVVSFGTCVLRVFPLALTVVDQDGVALRPDSKFVPWVAPINYSLAIAKTTPTANDKVTLFTATSTSFTCNAPTNLDTADKYYSSCTIKDLAIDLWSGAFSPTKRPASTTTSEKYYLYIKIKSPRSSALESDWFQIPSAITWVPLPNSFTITLLNGAGPLAASKYFLTPGSAVQFQISPSDLVAQNISATIECSSGTPTILESTLWNTQVGILNMLLPRSAADTMCTLSVSLVNQNGGSTVNTLQFAVVTLPPVSAKSPPIQVNSSIATGFQSTPDSLTVDWRNHFSQDQAGFCLSLGYPLSQCVSGIVSYSYSVQISYALSPTYSGPRPQNFPSQCASSPCSPCSAILFAGLTFSTSYVDQRTCLSNALSSLDAYGQQLNCINCFNIAITVSITATNIVGLTAVDTVTVPYSGAPAVVSALSFSGSKIPYGGKLWYTNVITALFNTTISSATAPWTGAANVVLGISVGAYPLSAGNLATLHDVSALLYDPNSLATSVFPGTPPSTAFRATTLQFRGAAFHGESYKFLLSVTSAASLSSSASSFVYLDITPPVVGSAYFTSMVLNDAAQQAQVALLGLFDPESGIKEIWWRVGGDSASVQARDFGKASSWVNLTDLTMSTTIRNLPSSAQTITVDLAKARAAKWTRLYFTLVVMNHAWTTPDDTLGVAYADLIPLELNSFTASISITGIDVAGSSQSQNITAEQTVEVHWLASNVVAGIAFLTAQLSAADRKIVTVPYYPDSAYQSIDIPFGGPIPANVQMTVCVNATSNSIPPVVHSDCKPFVRPPILLFDASCMKTGLVYSLQSETSAVATLFSNWTSCLLPDIQTIPYWLVSDTDFRPVVSGSVAVSKLGVSISIDASWISDKYKFCFMVVTGSSSSSQNFCTAPQALDLTPPVSLGQIYDAYSGGGLDPNALAVRYSSNRATYLVRWDDWIDPDSGIKSFSLSLMLDGQLPRVISQTTLTGDKRAFLFDNLALNVSSKYFATLSATNNALLASPIVRSPGVDIVAVGVSGSPKIAFANGIDVMKNGSPAQLFIPGVSAFIELSWSGFTADSVLMPKYRVDLVSNFSSTALPISSPTTQNDIRLQVPSRDDIYVLSVTLENPDGTTQKAVADQAIWVSKLQIIPPSKVSCDVDFTKLSPGNHTVPFTATLVPAADPQGLLVSQSIGFRHAGMAGESSSVLQLTSNDTRKSGRVVYIWGAPSVQDDYPIECVWQGADITGQITTMSYSGNRVGSSSTLPTAFALSSWTKVSEPSSGTDLAFFDEVAITPNSTFMVGMQSFSPIVQHGVQVASLSYCITLDSVPATAGTVAIKDTRSTAGVLYLTATDTISVSWEGFLKTNWHFTNDSGILSYQWAVGSFAGADDYVAFSSVPGMEDEATAAVRLTDGSSLYATVAATDYAGRTVKATSSLVLVDSTPPVLASALTVLARTNPDGTTFVRIDFLPWQDPESSLASVVWTVESAYGAADILSITPVTFSNVAYANLPLQPGVTYLARMIATNRALLSEEVVYNITAGAAVKMLYLVDGTNPQRNQLFDANPRNYSVSWNFTGSIHAFVVGVGTSPRQDDIWSFRQVDASLRSLTVPLKVSDGAKVYATVFVQDYGGNFQSFVTAGMVVDKSPPVRGWVTVGEGMVHQMVVPNQASISASWIGFNDAESDIARYEYCLDLDADIYNPRCAITNSWVTAWTQLQIVGAPIAGGALLPANRQCFVKVRATNHAGLSVIAVSPPFVVDPALPQGGQISITFPSADTTGGTSLTPLAKDGTQLYLDPSTVNVTWSFTSGNVEDYRVALFQAPGTAIKSFVSVGAQSSFTFVNLALQTRGPGQNYFAVVQAWTAAGLYSEIKRPFRVIGDSPGAGQVTVVSVDAATVTFFVNGFFDPNALAVTYEFSLGTAPYATDQKQIRLADCGVAPCSYSISAPISVNTIYYLTARADGTSLTLKVIINGATSNAVQVWRRDLRTDWAPAIPQVGLATGINSKYRLSTKAAIVRWTTAVNTISHFRIKRGNDILAQIWPSSARNATVLTGTAMTGTETFAVCAYFSDLSSSCVAAPPVIINLIPPAINSSVSTDHGGPLSTTVRITTAPNLLPLGTSQYLGTTAVDISWQNSFIPDGGKVISYYLMMLGSRPMTALNGTVITTTLTSASVAPALVAGVQYFATVIAVDETGIRLPAYSSPFVIDISDPDLGTVNIGKSFYIQPVAYQTNSTAVDFYLRGWSDHISGIKEFFYRICTATSCVPSNGASIGLAVDNTVPATLLPGVAFWVSVRATNGAGRVSNWVNSSEVVVDNKAPLISSVDFIGTNAGFAIAPVSGLGLSWNASTGESAPIREFVIQVGTTRGGGQLLPPTSVGPQTSFSLGTLALTHNIVLYATVIAISQNGLSAVRVSAGLRTDFSEPRVVGQVLVLSGDRYVNAIGPLTVTADWTGVFSDAESPIVRYEWAIGTAGARTQYTGGNYKDSQMATQLRYACEPTDNSDFVVTVNATNAAGLSASATSMLVMKASKHPPSFAIGALNEGTVERNGTWFIPSSIARFSLNGLADPDIGLKGVDIQLLDVATNSPIRDWFAIGIPVSISLKVEPDWLFKSLQLKARAANNLNLTTTASSFPFVLNSTDAV